MRCWGKRLSRSRSSRRKKKRKCVNSIKSGIYYKIKKTTYKKNFNNKSGRTKPSVL